MSLHVSEGPGLSTIEATADGLVLYLARAKTDQQAEGIKLGVPYSTKPGTCPVRAFLRWRDRQPACLSRRLSGAPLGVFGACRLNFVKIDILVL